MAVEISKFEVSDYLSSSEDIAAYLNAVMEENDPALLQAALGDVAKAKGMTEVAAKAGAGRESLYKSLRGEANPSFKTIVKVAEALGVRISFVPSRSA